MLSLLETTTIGSFPKPSFVPIRDWFDLARQKGAMDTIETTLQYNPSSHKQKNPRMWGYLQPRPKSLHSHSLPLTSKHLLNINSSSL